MTYVMMPELQVVLFFSYPIVESLDKIFRRYFAMDCVIIYRITIIANILDKVVNCMEFMIVEGWSK